MPDRPDPAEFFELERRTFRHAGAKEEAIRTIFGLSWARYQQLLNRMLEDPTVVAAFPVDVKRLVRLRDGRVRARVRSQGR
jgi:hypothetical protein